MIGGSTKFSSNLIRLGVGDILSNTGSSDKFENIYIFLHLRCFTISRIYPAHQVLLPEPVGPAQKILLVWGNSPGANLYTGGGKRIILPSSIFISFELWSPIYSNACW